MRKRIYSLNEKYFEKIDTAEKAYWLGFIIADGGIEPNRSALRLHLGVQDIDHLEKFKMAIGSNAPVKITKRGKCRLDINSTLFCNYLSKYGVVPCKTHKVFTPNIEDKFKSHFYRGFMDGDGWITHNYERYFNKQTGKNERKNTIFGNIGFCSANQNFIYDIREWISSQVLNAKGCLMNRTIKSGDFYQLIYGGNRLFLSIGDLLYSDENSVFLDRKRKKYLEIKKIIIGYNIDKFTKN